MDHVLGLKCLICGKTYGVDEALYVCPEHGDEGILDVQYDYEKIKGRISPQTLSAGGPRSMWRYLPLLPVDPLVLSDLHGKGPPAHPLLSVGWTPLYRSPGLAGRLGLAEVFVKNDGLMPSASLKDRASAVAILKALELGRDVISGASTGNAASSLATLSASLGLKNIIFLPAAAPQAKIAQLLVYGATVLAVDGTYDQAFDLCLAASKAHGWYNRNTAYNPYMTEGKKTAAYEICEQLGFALRAPMVRQAHHDGLSKDSGLMVRQAHHDGLSKGSGLMVRQAHHDGLSKDSGLSLSKEWQVPDRVFVGVGDGCIIGGLHKGFKDMLALGWIERLPRLMGVQAAGSAALYRAWTQGVDPLDMTPIEAHTVADSISAGLPRDRIKATRAVVETDGAFVSVTDEEILEAMPILAREAGVFAEPAGAAPYAGLAKAVAQGLVAPQERVVVLATGNGLKDVESAIRAVGRPTIIAPELDAVDAALGVGC